MSPSVKMAAAMVEAGRERLCLPEHRQIELHSKRKTLDFAEGDDDQAPYALLAGVVRAFHLMETLLAARYADGEAPASWAFYSRLPRDSGLDKVVSQLYRILRAAKLVLFHPHGHVEAIDGAVKINGFVGRVALSLEITPIGLTLLQSAAAYWALAQSSPYPLAYVEAMLNEYFFDVTGEIRRFADEDRVLYQFRRPRPFGRHFRFDCDNPKLKQDDDGVTIEIAPLYRDKARFPIDFFFVLDHALHIAPVEALNEGRIRRADLDKWRARLGEGEKLPAEFAIRFGRHQDVVGQPMT